jgi:hypothetical protein
LPSLKKIKVKGKDQWDDSDCIEFLENMLKEEILPQIKNKPAAQPTVKTTSKVTEDAQYADDDLPF